MTAAPGVSVVMPVHNGERFLREAVDSVLGQSMADLELIAVNDGSDDATSEILASFRDPRLVVIDQAKAGVTAALNAGLAAARAPYVARQDADDISLPGRLARLRAALDADPRLGLVGSNYTVIDDHGRRLVTTRLFCHPDDVKVGQVLANQFGHGSVMFRRSVVDTVGGYRGLDGYATSLVEDADLWLRISRVSRIANVPESLYLWRRHASGTGARNAALQVEQAHVLRDLAFRVLLDNRSDYRLLTSVHPRGFGAHPLAYAEKKSAAFRDLAYLYRLHDRRRTALGMQAVGCLFAPWRRRNWRYLRLLLADGDIRSQWTYEHV